MAIARIPDHGNQRGELGSWALRLAAACGVSFAAALASFGIAYAIGGADATADNWVGQLVVGLGLFALVGSAAAFVLAIIAEIEHEHRASLWLPLSLFPALGVFLVVGEALWWE